MSLFAEGIRSSLLPCSYSVLLVGLALLLVRRRERMAVLGIFAGFTILSAWIRASGISNALAGRVATTVLVIGGLGLALLVNHRLVGLGAAALVGTFAGATWLPCVGAELGLVLTDAWYAPASALLPLGVYLVGVMIPLVAIMALLAYVRPLRRWADGRRVAMVGRGVMAAVAILVLIDYYDTVLSTLARWSVL